MQGGRNNLSLINRAHLIYIFTCLSVARIDCARFKQGVRVRNASTVPQQSFSALLRTRRKQAKKMLISLNFEAAMAKDMKTPQFMISQQAPTKSVPGGQPF